MQLKDVLVFRSPTRIDWTATETKIVEQVIKEHPDSRPSECAMTSARTVTSVRKTVRRLGVTNLWSIIKAVRDQESKQ